MSGSANRVLIGGGLAVLVGALVFLNQGVKKAAVPEHDEEAAAQAKKAPTTPVKADAVLASEETVGDPAAKHHITVGWIYTYATFSHPEGLAVPLQAVRDVVKNSGGIASAEIVNLDVPLEERSPAAQTVTDLGVSVDGKTLFDSNPGDTPVPAQTVMEQIVQAMK